MNKKLFLLAAAAVPFIFASCSGTVSLSVPLAGMTNIVPLPVKDFETRGIIFVKAQKKTDSKGNVSGSEVTYQMLLLEAQKLGADDVVNVRMDENVTVTGSGAGKVRTSDYTATALAIKYKRAGGYPAPRFQSDENESETDE
jgi:hypothetical protein